MANLLRFRFDIFIIVCLLTRPMRPNKVETGRGLLTCNRLLYSMMLVIAVKQSFCLSLDFESKRRLRFATLYSVML